MNTLNEKNLKLIEQEKARTETLKQQVLKKCNLDNIIELVNKKEAGIAIIEMVERFSNTAEDYINITFRDKDYSILIDMNGDIKLCMNFNPAQEEDTRYMEDYTIIDVEDGNTALVNDLYDYIFITETNNKLEEFINDKI